MAEAKIKTESKTKVTTTKPGDKSLVSEKKPAKKKDEKIITEVTAKARFVKSTPRKIRLIIDQIKGLDAEEALHLMKFYNKRAVLPISKLLSSAIANAENNFQVDKKDLFIKKITSN